MKWGFENDHLCPVKYGIVPEGVGGPNFYSIVQVGGMVPIFVTKKLLQNIRTLIRFFLEKKNRPERKRRKYRIDPEEAK